MPYLISPILSGYNSAIALIIYVHMALCPMKVLKIDTAGKANVLDAVRSAHTVETGWVCTSQNDIVSVDGLANDAVHQKYWTIEVNGDYEHVNSESPVNASDKLVLKYASLRER